MSKPWNVRLQETNERLGIAVPLPPADASKRKKKPGVQEIYLEQDTLVGRPNNAGGIDWSITHKGSMIDAADRRRAKDGVQIRMIPIRPEDEGRSIDWLVDNYVTMAAVV